MAAKQSKPVSRQQILTKLVKRLRKEFGRLPRKRDPMPVLETMLYAVCLEDASFEACETVFDRLQDDFFDWNEIRVSTITELEPTFEGLPEPARRAMRVRYLLYYVFDHQFSYNFDAIKRKPLELVNKQLNKIKHLPPFARNYLLQNALGIHVLPIDGRMLQVAIYLGLVPARATVENAPELLKAHIRKADGLEFYWLLKCVSISSQADILLGMENVSEDADIENLDARLDDLLSGRLKRRVQAARRKVAAEKAARAKAAAKKRATAERAKKKAVLEAAAKKKAKAAAKKKAAAKAAKKKAKKKAAKKKATKKKTGRKK